MTLGFDLELTLVDLRAGLAALLAALAADTGTALDGWPESALHGEQLERQLARYGLDPATHQRVLSGYHARYQDLVIPRTAPLPGAHEAVQAAERVGRVIVTSPLPPAQVSAHLAAVGFSPDLLADGMWQGTATVLRIQAAEVFVGGRLTDIVAARDAGAMAVAVATGPDSPDELRAAGADVVLADLTAFPAWLDSYLAATVH